MKKIVFCLLSAAVFALTLSRSAAAAYLEPSLPVPVALNKAQIIVVAKIVKSESLPATAAAGKDEPFLCIKPKKYSLAVVRTLKGEPAPTLTVVGTAVSPEYYDGVLFDENASDTFLWSLSRSGNTLVPTDAKVPLIPVRLKRAEATAPNSGKGSDAVASVQEILLETAKDKALRKLSAYFLKDFSSPIISKGLSAYMRDLDADYIDNVLFCCIKNNSIPAIPFAGALAEKQWKQKEGPLCLTAMEELKDDAAVDEIGKLLFADSPFNRVNAVSALARLKNAKSTPYLMIGIIDTDPYVSYLSYKTLHELIPVLGQYGDTHYFSAHKAEEVCKAHTWWVAQKKANSMPK